MCQQYHNPQGRFCNLLKKILPHKKCFIALIQYWTNKIVFPSSHDTDLVSISRPNSLYCERFNYNKRPPKPKTHSLSKTFLFFESLVNDMTLLLQQHQAFVSTQRLHSAVMLNIPTVTYLYLLVALCGKNGGN